MTFLLYGWIPEDERTRLEEAVAEDCGDIVVVERIPTGKSEEARWHGIVRSADSRGYFFPGVPGSTHAAAREFEKALEAVLNVVAVETRFRKIGAEIGKATRRINVLNKVLLPGLRARMRAILLSLEEREREDIFRMKRFKGRSGTGE
ncbi:MAG TPA: V-type ATP synthase subunit D [Candidatus Deferrimicrobiaceae bacterium]